MQEQFAVAAALWAAILCSSCGCLLAKTFGGSAAKL
jgi:ribosomal protein S27E